MEGEERQDGRRTVEKSAEQWPPEPKRDRESASLGRTGSGFSRLERKSDGRTEGKQWLEDEKSEKRGCQDAPLGVCITSSIALANQFKLELKEWHSVS
ncbi:uncharacterized [Tachysurus ichikawai]